MPALLAASCLLCSLLALPSPVLAAVTRPESTAVLVLMDPGAAPRRTLRLAQPEGWRQRARLSVDVEVDTEAGQGADGEQRTEYGPEVVVPLRVGRAPTHEDGGARYWLSMGRPEVRVGGEQGPEVAWRLAEEWGALSGGRAEVVLSPTGMPQASWLGLRGVESPPGMEEVLALALSSDWYATPQFPDAPVGVGARWAVVRARGADALTVITYELMESRGSRGRVRFQLQTRGPRGRARPTVEGELRFDLSRPLPERLEALHTSRTAWTVAGRGLVVVRRTRVVLEAGALEHDGG